MRLTATMPWSPAAPGERSEIRLDLEIARGWHINCHQPRQEFLIPTAVRLGAGLPVELGEISYPEGRDIELAGEQVRVYDGKLTLLVPLAVRPSARAGTYHLALTLRFQACDSSACLAPQELTVQIPVRIAAGRR